MRFYTVYDAKDDTIVASGSASECTDQLDFKSLDSFYCMISRVLKGQNRKYKVVKDFYYE